MSEHWIVPARLFDGKDLQEGVALRVQHGIVTDVLPAADLPEKGTSLTIAGLVTPGFVDLQVNGGGGVLFNQDPNAAGIAHIAAAHYRLGTVALMPTVITDAPSVIEAAVQAALDAKAMPHFAGLHLEGPHIDPRKRGTHAAAFIRPLDDTTVQALQRLRQAGITVMITLAPEAATADQITKLAAMGVIVSLGHSNCTAAQAGQSFAAGARCVTHLFNAMSQMEGRAPGLAGAAIGSDAFVGMICDGVHVSDDMLALALRARPLADRSFLVSDAMPTVGGPDHFRLYGQDITLQNGRLINAEGNLAGAHSTMAAGLARLVTHVRQPLQTALRMGITVPANLIERPDLAQINGRAIADLMILDADLQLSGSLQSAIDKHAA
ncbi:MAG: N-acetylglucosamine-6-phosphate deacetylase [Yoonia sp.]|uniref:N-acetylglucosamine-6-phosphate deacetylase n=1 Tax=Yoonia sp. TaxID=2212373 RepID=UPI00273E49B4|nr:N-acetylglucosamine-6-phosphate deacetylase [Yoonia sp.]MDP5085720.1 N-acetylglucosamine-6-phosphate deacetylase [Yoonia sp.]MDP5362904.1 N-acetylglucosamine-6-phosphate deacetylase [Paracoccaceae bacterium]